MKTTSGIVLLDKALAKSSNTALQEVKRLFKVKKAGHTGSLDPLATGLLPICLGQATKLSQFLLNANKGYIATGQLGQQTSTADREGKIIKTLPFSHITTQDLLTTLKTFLGQSQQIPPMYSALKKDGQPLYQLARQGIEVERKPRNIEIFQLDLLSFDQQIGIFEIEAVCSKGTYIRTLIEDIAKRLNTIAFTNSLRRTQFAHYNINQSISFTQLIDNQDKLTDFVLPMVEVLPQYPIIKLTENQVQDICYGQSIIANKSYLGLVKLLTPENYFLAIGLANNQIISPKRLLMTDYGTK